MRFGKRLRRRLSAEGDRDSDPATEDPTDHEDREAERGGYGSEPAAEMSVDFSAERVARFLFVAAAALVLTSFATGLPGLFGAPFVRLFYVGSDLSLPAWYSTLALVLASGLLVAIALAVRASDAPRYGRRWAALGIVFAYLSCDEMLRLHERIAGTLLQPALETLGFIPTGILYYPWVIIYAPLVVLFVVAYFRFWRELPERIRTLFLAAGAIFVGGALGVELFNAYHDEAPGRELLVFIGTHVEESLEMAGVAIFAYALLSYMESHLELKALRLRL